MKCCICNKQFVSKEDIEVIKLKDDLTEEHIGSICPKCYAKILMNTRKTIADILDPLEEDYFRGMKED